MCSAENAIAHETNHLRFDSKFRVEKFADSRDQSARTFKFNRRHEVTVNETVMERQYSYKGKAVNENRSRSWSGLAGLLPKPVIMVIDNLRPAELTICRRCRDDVGERKPARNTCSECRLFGQAWAMSSSTFCAIAIK
jgi:hypothetical protein